jgi:bifunctional hydroxylase/dehydrase
MAGADTDVIIVGAGPVGLMLAGELRLGGARCIVLERSAEPVDQSRALGFTARTIEVFGQRGLLPRFGGFGTIPVGHFGGIQLDYRELEGGSYGAKGVPQSLTVAILEEWARELGADIRRGWEADGFEAGGGGVTVDVTGPAGPARLAASYLVGCDGGRSMVRKRAGIPFPGYDAEIEMSFAELTGCHVRPRPNGERVPGGMVLAFQQEGGVYRVTYYERGAVPRPGVQPPTFAEVADAWERLTGEDIRAGTPLWTGRFTDASRQASRYRRGRVFLAGDAAHIHLPIGGQGMSTGVQDAVNLGWKLAAEVRGHAPPDLLDTYHSERHPVGTRVVNNTLAQRILYLTGGETMLPVRGIFSELASFAPVRRHLIGMVTGLDIVYDMGEGSHPLLGRRLPGTPLAGDFPGTGVIDSSDLMHAAHGVVLDLDGNAAVRRAAAPWAGRVDTVTATPHPAGADSPLGTAGTVLVRPDGYVAWAGSAAGEPDGLVDALTRWFGKPEPS